MNKSQQIRDYAVANPNAKAKEIGEALGVKPTYVHAVLWAVKARTKKARVAATKKTDWRTLHISSSDNSIEKVMERETLKLPEVGDTVGGLVFTKLKNGKFRWLPPAMVPMPEPKQIEMFEPEADPVNHPAHYKVGGIETIDFIEAKRLNYNMGNAVKYITRADHKGNRKQDLEKAIWYLKRELDHSI